MKCTCPGPAKLQPDGSYRYRCGHVYRVVLRLREPERKPVQSTSRKKAA